MLTKRNPPVGARPGILAIPSSSPSPRIFVFEYWADSVEEKLVEDPAELITAPGLSRLEPCDRRTPRHNRSARTRVAERSNETNRTSPVDRRGRSRSKAAVPAPGVGDERTIPSADLGSAGCGQLMTPAR